MLTFFCPLTAKAAGGIELSTAYPGITVKAGEAVSVNLDLENTSGSAFDAALSTVSMPEGWEGYFSGGGKQISKVHAPNGETVSGVTFQMTIPKDAAEGTYQVQLLSLIHIYKGSCAQTQVNIKIKSSIKDVFA